MNENRTNVTVWDGDGTGGLYSGMLDRTLDAWTRELADGAAITTVGYQPGNHHIIGLGIGHDDAKFAEQGESMAAYYENGEAYNGRWWETGESARHFRVAS